MKMITIKTVTREVIIKIGMAGSRLQVTLNGHPGAGNGAGLSFHGGTTDIN